MKDTMANKKNNGTEMEALRKEAQSIIIKRSGISLKRLYENAVNEFVANNIDLLTPSERKKYSAVIPEPEQETVSISFDENDLRARLAVDLLVSLGARIVNIEYDKN